MISSLRSALARMRAFANKPVRDADLDQELASHLDFATEENLRRGLSPQEARRQALVRFGGVQQSREQQRAARGLPALDILMQDLRYTLRTLWPRPRLHPHCHPHSRRSASAPTSRSSVWSTRSCCVRFPSRILLACSGSVPRSSTATGLPPPTPSMPTRSSASATNPTPT